jgi:hypothetical protein
MRDRRLRSKRRSASKRLTVRIATEIEGSKFEETFHFPLRDTCPSVYGSGNWRLVRKVCQWSFPLGPLVILESHMVLNN